jgi:molybdenum cofactor biosynthesis enzyme
LIALKKMSVQMVITHAGQTRNAKTQQNYMNVTAEMAIKKLQGHIGVCHPVIPSKVVTKAIVWHPIIVIVTLAMLEVDVQLPVNAMKKASVGIIQQRD